VSSIGYFEGEFAHARELAVPSATMQLLVNLDHDLLSSDTGTVRHTGGAALQGPHARPAVIDPAQQRAILWVGFRLGGAYPFFSAPAEATRDQLVDLGELWGRGGAVLRERLLASSTPEEKLRTVEDVLLARAVRPLERDPAITLAAQALHCGATVTAVADRLGWTSKRLMRRFTEQIGLPPKRFARVRRFQRLLAAVGGRRDVDWARLAVEYGYHDQAHLIHDFRAFAGMTPTEYAPRSPGEHNHIPLEG
jgi:AraC-like DNA-binding protein